MQKRYLIIRYSSLGDIILCLKPARLFLKQHKDIHLDILSSECVKEILEKSGIFNRVYCLPEKKLSGDTISLLHSMSKTTYAAVFDLQNKVFSRIFACLLKKNEFRVYRKRTLKEQLHFGLLGKYPIKLANEEPVSFRYTKVFQLKIKNLVAKFSKTPGVFMTLRASLPREKIILLHPHARNAGKTNFALFHKILGFLNSAGYAVAVIGQGNFELSKFPTVLDWQNKLDLSTLLQKLACSTALISTDSAPMHLAAETGIPVFCYFFQTAENLGFAPMAENVSIFPRDLYCRPCSLHGRRLCPIGTWECKGIEPYSEELQWLKKKLHQFQI
ncbi:glycosyltransferase family 9 protein [Candidatus Riflebacteria bacterium]